MPRSRGFRAAGWETLEGRSLLSTVAGPTGPSPVVPVARTDAYSEARLASNLQQAEQGGAEIVILGDSIADYWTTHGAASWRTVMAPRGAVDFGIIGNTTGELLSQIAAGELAGKPKVVVLMIGANNIVQGNSPAQVAQGIAANVAAVRAASPQSQVVLMGVLPISGAGNGPLTWKVTLVNAMISRLDDGAHVHYVNIGSSYLLPDGSQNRALYADIVHLSPAGYSVWASQISGTLDVLTGHAAAVSSTSLTPPPAPPPTLPPRFHRRG